MPIDTSDMPEVGEDWFRRARLVTPDDAAKAPVVIFKLERLLQVAVHHDDGHVNILCRNENRAIMRLLKFTHGTVFNLFGSQKKVYVRGRYEFGRLTIVQLLHSKDYPAW